jgi:tetratricopeptide (TPR) repeat protein
MAKEAKAGRRREQVTVATETPTAEKASATRQLPHEGPPRPDWWTVLRQWLHDPRVQALRLGAIFLAGSFYQVAVKLPWLIAMVLITVLLVEGLIERKIAIEPISVPKDLVDRGFTPEVAAKRLHDALERVTLEANTHMRGPEVALRGDLPDIVVPTVGLSLDAIMSSIRTFLRSTRRRSISGEFTVRDKLLWLRLRIDGNEIYQSLKGVNPETPDELLAEAARPVLEVVQPYIVAAWLSAKGDTPKALEMAKGITGRLPESDENVAWSYNLIGSIYRERKEYDKATAALKEAIRLAPRLPGAYTNLGSTFNDQGNYEAAIAQHHKAIEFDPKYAVPHNNLGLVLSARGKDEEAIVEYRKAIELDPNNANQRFNLGVVLRARNENEEAIVEYRKAIELDPKYAFAHRNLGIVLRAQGKDEEAIVEYRKAIEIDPKYANAHISLGIVLRAQGKDEEAIVEYLKAIELDPKNANPRVNLGVVLRAQGKVEEAIVEYRKAIEINPKYALAHRNLGLALRDQSIDKEAIAEFREVLKIEPNDTTARDNLDELLKEKGKPK